MILGIGTDILQLQRAANALERTPNISQRILTPNEYQTFLKTALPTAYFAKRFSAKEAIVKALGTGIGRGVGWQHIEIVNNDAGKPEVILSGGALAAAQAKGIQNIHISYSDEQDYVVAFAIAEG